jgi:hypothetical protein
MKTKSLIKLTETLNKNEGASFIAIIAMLVIMSVMGGVFSSVMGRWKISAPTTINSNKAFYLAETAAMFALQDAKYRFFSVDATSTPPGEPLFPAATTGTRSAPYIVSFSSTETAEYWIERPYPSANTISANEIPPNAINVDEYPSGTHRGLNDDEKSGADDDVVDDDLDDPGNDSLYTIIATGKVIRDGTPVAKRQIKIRATITDSSGDPIDPGIHAEGSIRGSGSGAFQIWQDGLDVATDAPSVTFSNGTYADSGSGQYSGSRTDVVYQATAFDPPDLDEEFFKAIATDQGHANPSISNGSIYPVGSSSYYYDAPTNTMPNVTYISGDLDVNNVMLYGIYYITGAVTMQGNMHVEGIIIGNSTIKLSASNAASDPHLDGGIIQLGSGQVWGAGNPSTIQINDDFFDALNTSIPIITVQSLHEAVSAN